MQPDSRSSSHNDLPNDLCRDLARSGMIRAGERIGVAVSGGADSVALLRLLHAVRDDLGICLTVLHFNHRLRGAESDADERFVAALAAELNLSLFLGSDDVAAAARERGWNLEDAGRRLRYAWFASLIHGGAVAKVAVAHTADDQAETVLARLIRGTGPAGLAAIYPAANLDLDVESEAEAAEAGGPLSSAPGAFVVRPLLGTRRAALRAWLESAGKPWREDPSNQDTTRLRARLRHDLLPAIEHELQPAIVGHLGRLAQLAREDEAFWSAFVAERLGELTERRPHSPDGGPGGRIGIRCSDLSVNAGHVSGAAAQTDAALAVSRRLIRGIVEELRGDCRRLTAGHVEQVLRLSSATGSSGRRIDLPGVVVERSFDWLWFSAAPVRDAESDHEISAADPVAYAREIAIASIEETVVDVPEICARFRLKVIDWPLARSENYREYGVLDRDLLRSPLVLRSWRPGDSFRPHGRQGVQKLKHFLRVRRVARQDRFGWPVLTSDGELAWARGLPVAASFAPGDVTRAGVVIIEEN